MAPSDSLDTAVAISCRIMYIDIRYQENIARTQAGVAVYGRRCPTFAWKGRYSQRYRGVGLHLWNNETDTDSPPPFLRYTQRTITVNTLLVVECDLLHIYP